MDNDKKIQQALDDLEIFTHIILVATQNIDRIVRIIGETNLIIDRMIAGEVKNRQETISYIHDIWRAQVVFIHSTLETVLRDVVGVKIRYGDDLVDIPLTGEFKSNNRNEKFNLQQLSNYRANTVEEVIEKSITDYIFKLTFNNTTDISRAMEKLEIPQETLRPFYKDLEAMIARRHQIVHEGDILRNSKPSTFVPIDLEIVSNWIKITINFISEFMALVFRYIATEIIFPKLQKVGVEISKENLANMLEKQARDKLQPLSDSKSYNM